jgi:hypothetical protein
MTIAPTLLFQPELSLKTEFAGAFLAFHTFPAFSLFTLESPWNTTNECIGGL